MMAAYQPTPGGVHPGLQHGHPGMGPNPGQHMGQPMQMHPGVSGAPHQGAMMGMQPGANNMGPGQMGGQHPGGGMAMQAHMGGQSMAGGMPNAQALSHMTSQQQLAHQQQQFAAMAANPQLAMQHHQMRLRQQAMLQQAQANGMMNVNQPGMQMNPQLAQLQQQQAAQQAAQSGGQQVQLTPHLQQQQMQMMQQQAMQRQQAAQQQHQHQQTQLAQQMAMQHASSQQSNPSQAAPPNPQNQAANAAAQQVRPQSRVANPNEQTPNNPQQHSQQSPAQQAQPQAQQTPQQGQAANPQQQGPQQQQMANAQRHAQIQLQFRQQAMQQQQARAAQQAQQANAQSGMFILKLMNFNDHLSNFSLDNENSTAYGKNITHWHNFVEKHFAPDGRLIIGFPGATDHNGNATRKSFEVLRPNVARYFYTHFDSGASSLRLHTEHAREAPHPTTGGQQVTCQKSIFSISYPNGARLEMTGTLQVLFSAGSDAIECLSLQTTSTEETLSRSQIEKVLTDYSPTMSHKTSPKLTKKKLPAAQQRVQDEQNKLTIEHFPKTPRGSMGFTSKVQHFLEIGETMNIMSDLMHASQEKKMRPEQALEALVGEWDVQSGGQQGGNPQINLPNGAPQGARTPSMANMQMGQNGQFSSPNVSHMSLPMNGSPHIGHPGNLAPGMNMANSHTPSPHQSNMAAPPMMPQHSAQGTNSSVASENTSPNLNNNNKRRRSTVKMEDDHEPARVKPSPRMPKKSKP